MNNVLKKILLLLMVVSLTLTYTPLSVFAGKYTATVINENGEEVTYEFDTQEELDAFWKEYFNTEFPDDDFEIEYDEPVDPDTPEVDYDEIPDIIEIKSEKDLANAIIKNIRNGKGEVYYSDVPCDNLQDVLIDILKSSKSFDKYDIYNINRFNIYTEAFMDKDGSTILAYTLSFERNTTKEQEEKTDKVVADLINDNNLKAKSDYECIKFVYDYLVDNVKYDYTYSKVSAYNALIEKKSVCSGYALAFQKIMDALEIPCSYIINYNHAWNSVYLDGKWYNIDVTWGSNESYYRYLFFLQDDSYFKPTHQGVSFSTATSPYKVKGAKYSFKLYQQICAVNTRVYIVQEGKNIGYIHINTSGGAANLSYKLFSNSGQEDKDKPTNKNEKEDTTNEENLSQEAPEESVPDENVEEENISETEKEEEEIIDNEITESNGLTLPQIDTDKVVLCLDTYFMIPGKILGFYKHIVDVSIEFCRKTFINKSI